MKNAKDAKIINVYVTQCIDEGVFNDEALKYLKKNSSKNVRIILVDNGSAKHLRTAHVDRIIRFNENVGGNAIPWFVMEEGIEADVELSCFFHADVMVVEKKWDVVVQKAFRDDPKLALLGFVGSNEIGQNGGRGSGTKLNFQGREYKMGIASPAEHHGLRINSEDGVYPAACLDFCVQIYRTSVIHKLEQYWADATVMHFEDRIVPLELIAKGYHVGIIGVACDHLNGAKGQCSKSYAKAVYRWFEKHYNEIPADQYRYLDADALMYAVSEYRFLSKWRDKLGWIPFRVNKDYSWEKIS